MNTHIPSSPLWMSHDEPIAIDFPADSPLRQAKSSLMEAIAAANHARGLEASAIRDAIGGQKIERYEHSFDRLHLHLSGGLCLRQWIANALVKWELVHSSSVSAPTGPAFRNSYLIHRNGAAGSPGTYVWEPFSLLQQLIGHPVEYFSADTHWTYLKVATTDEVVFTPMREQSTRDVFLQWSFV